MTLHPSINMRLWPHSKQKVIFSLLERMQTGLLKLHCVVSWTVTKLKHQRSVASLFLSTCGAFTLLHWLIHRHNVVNRVQLPKNDPTIAHSRTKLKSDRRTNRKWMSSFVSVSKSLYFAVRYQTLVMQSKQAHWRANTQNNKISQELQTRLNC